MNGFAERRTSGSSDCLDGVGGLLTWEAASAMLALAGRISADIVRHEDNLARLVPEKASLDALRHELSWPHRERRYELERDIAQLAVELGTFRSELEGLGVVLLDSRSGLIGFPTIVNEQRAFFSWKPGESELGHWNYLGHQERHPVPASWTKQVTDLRPARGRSRTKH